METQDIFFKIKAHNIKKSMSAFFFGNLDKFDNFEKNNKRNNFFYVIAARLFICTQVHSNCYEIVAYH